MQLIEVKSGITATEVKIAREDMKYQWSWNSWLFGLRKIVDEVACSNNVLSRVSSAQTLARAWQTLRCRPGASLHSY